MSSRAAAATPRGSITLLSCRATQLSKQRSTTARLAHALFHIFAGIIANQRIFCAVRWRRNARSKAAFYLRLLPQRCTPRDVDVIRAA